MWLSSTRVCPGGRSEQHLAQGMLPRLQRLRSFAMTECPQWGGVAPLGVEIDGRPGVSAEAFLTAM